MIEVSTTQYDFGRVALGTESEPMQLNIANNSDSTATVTISRSHQTAADYCTNPAKQTFSLDSQGTCTLRITFVPHGLGARDCDLLLEARYSRKTTSTTVSVVLHGIGAAPERLTLQRIAFCPAGTHYGVVLSCDSYLKQLNQQANLPIPTYIAVISGTRGGRVNRTTPLAPGDVFLSESASNLPNPALISAFLLQSVSTNVLARTHTVLSSQDTISRLHEALLHAFHSSCDPKPMCQHCHSNHWRYRRDHSLPRQGEVVTYRPRRGRSGMYVVITPQTFAEYFKSKLDTAYGIVLPTTPRDADDSDTMWGQVVSTGVVPDFFVHCYLPHVVDLSRTRPTGASLRNVSELVSRVSAAIGLS